MSAIHNGKSLRQTCTDATAIFQRLTGYDRVMVYRFDDEGHGQVVAETFEKDLEPFIGMRYPSSDIPQIARRLYLQNRSRMQLARMDAQLIQDRNTAVAEFDTHRPAVATHAIVATNLFSGPATAEMEYHSTVSYDLIGDIHGHARPLVELLEKLGYARTDGIYRHPERQVIFLGDFIDRGPEQREVIDIARPMIDAGTALSVMGNHEFNAIAFATEDADETGSYLRPHSEKNRKQHQMFLDAYQESGDYAELIQWFRHLPLWLELDGLRVVHACWDDRLTQFLEKRYPAVNDYLDDELLVAASAKGRTEFKAVETLLKGREVPLPKGQHFHDKDGNPRHEIRVKWWDAEAKTYREAFLGPEAAQSHIPEDPLDVDHEIVYASDAPPVFVGHYWLDGEPDLLAPNVACLDYSVAAPRGGKLVAYRWGGEQALSRSNFVFVERAAG